ncbi:MAG: ComEC/Rec2 family competence protein, partial [Flavobacteriia bacterium]
ISFLFCVGIYVAEKIDLPLSAIFILLIFSLLFYYLIAFRKLFHAIKNLKTSTLLLIWFLMGTITYSEQKSENNNHSIFKNYLSGDYLLGQIISKTPTSGEYSKTEFEVNALLRGKDTIYVQDKVVLFLKDLENNLKEYDVCLINTEISRIVTKNNPGEFDSEFFWKHKGINYIGFANEDSYYKIGSKTPPWHYVFKRMQNYFSSILEKFISGDELGIAKGLILGDRSSLDSEITSKFGNTGAMHILAVSGLHVGILIQILTLFFGLFKKWISKNRAIIIALVIVWIYSLLTGFSASVVRSVVMFTLLIGSNLLQKNYNPFNVLAFSAVLILVWNPHFLFDIGFQLSYLAMFGIYMFYKPLSNVVYFKNKIIRMAFEGTMVGIAATILTLPLTLYYFHTFPNYFVLTNLALMIFSFLILVLGVSLFATSFISFLAKPIAWVLTFSLTVMLWIIDFIDGIPGAVSSGFVLNSVAVILLFGLILTLYYAINNAKLKLLNVTLLFAFIFTSVVVFFRYEKISSQQVCFLQADDPTFIIKLKDKNLVFYADKKANPKKASFMAKSFQKIYPGEIKLFEISQKKSTAVKFKEDSILIKREKGGYAIQVNKEDFFLATNLNNFSNSKRIIYSPWIDDSDGKYSLKNNSVQFFLN